MSDSMLTTSGYTLILTSQECSELSSLQNNVQKVQSYLNNAYASIVEQYDDQVYDLIQLGYKQGRFRDALTEIIGKPYLEWELIGNRNRYWRMLCAHVYQQYASRYERRQIVEIIKTGNYTSSTQELWDELRERKLYPTQPELLNIFKQINKGNESVFKIAQVPLDYTTGDEKNVNQEIDSNKIKVSIQCNRKKWYELEYKIPDHITQIITHISKPSIVLLDNGDIRVEYAVETASPVSTSANILGVDLGQVKKFTAASLDGNGNYSQELSPGRELEQNSRKEQYLLKNKSALYEKKTRISELIKYQDNVDMSLVEKYLLLDGEYHNVRSKLSLLKEHSSWLVSRDVTIHAIDQECSQIQVEKLSWVSNSDNQGKWDYAVTQQRIEHKAGKHGVVLEHVNPAYTSWEYPEEYAENPAPLADYDPSTRELINKNGDRLDKDYTASIAIAARYHLKECKGKNKKNKSRKRKIQPKKLRDKHSSTPKRARKKVLREFTQQEHEMIQGLLEQKVELNGFVLSLSRSVVTSTSRVVRDDVSQLVSNGDYSFVHS